MKRLIWSKHYCIKLLSGASVAAFLLVRWLVSHMSLTASDIGVGLAAADAVVFLLPVQGENVKMSLQCAFLGSVLPVIAGVFLSRTIIIVPFIILMLAAVFAAGLFVKYRSVRDIFQPEQTWKMVEADARWVYLLLFFVFCSFLIVADSIADITLVVAVTTLLAFLYCVLLLRSFFGTTAFLHPGKEKKIKNAIRGMMPAVTLPEESEDETLRMNRLYEKVVSLMENKKPFLDDEFSLADMAASVYTNKSYLSKTINVFSGRNFCQFVNYYRVKYSVDLMKNDPHLRVAELATMSGFHTVVTFNMAFKLNMNLTPSELLAKIRLEPREHPSSCEAGGPEPQFPSSLQDGRS
ncbi:MAG: AraC family transcriptional regulator [Bacteroidales bacterium]|nr:AraC family transcriptional regulator [Bacteroidales bacterium]